MVALGLGPDAAVTAVIAAAGHPVTRHGVSTYDDSVTREVLEATVAGESLGAVAGRLVGAEVVAVDAGVPGDPVPGTILCRATGPRGDLVSSDAVSPTDTARIVDAGRELGRSLGHRLVPLGEVGIGNTTVAAALVARRLGLGAGTPWVSAPAETRHAGAQACRGGPAWRGSRRPHADLEEPMATLAALGGPEIAYLTGVTLGAAEAGSLVVLDGLVTAAAALIAVTLEPAVAAHLVAGQESREQAHRMVNGQLGLEPLLSLRLRSGEGVGALLAVQLLRTAAGLRSQAGKGRGTAAGVRAASNGRHDGVGAVRLREGAFGLPFKRASSGLDRASSRRAHSPILGTAMTATNARVISVAKTTAGINVALPRPSSSWSAGHLTMTHCWNRAAIRGHHHRSDIYPVHARPRCPLTRRATPSETEEKRCSKSPQEHAPDQERVIGL